MSLFIGSVFAVLVCIYLIFIKEKYASKQYNVLYLSIAVGVAMALIAIIFQSTLNLLFEPTPFIKAFIFAATIEEVAKYLMIYFIVLKRNILVNTYDYIKVALLASLVFALIENILYVNVYYKNIGLDVAFIRMLSAIPLHALCGISMGYFLYIQKTNLFMLFRYFPIIIPIIIHGTYDYFLFVDKAFIAIIVLLFFTLFHLRPIKYFFEN